MTTRSRIGSWILIAPVISLGCGRTEAEPPRPPPPAPVVKQPAPPPPESCLGIADKGIWSDLDERVQIQLPAGTTPARVRATVDEDHHVLVLAIDDFPRKAYPLGGPAALDVGPFHLALRPGDRAELAPLLAADRIAAGKAAHDRDGDGIPDPLDMFVGAKKTVLNADAYTEGYFDMGYPMGDVDRKMGVCTDVIIRAVRNAGIDIQRELHEDIRRAHGAYPMVRGYGDPSIDQRRVATLLPYFKRHWQEHSKAIDDPKDPLRPGDVLFMDTFPTRDGPDHIGIVSDTLDADGLPLVINNWTNGTVTKEMDLLTFVPVMYRFRLPP
jgi:uncharacterized protein YijF (DUF1287 family)